MKSPTITHWLVMAALVGPISLIFGRSSWEEFPVWFQIDLLIGEWLLCGLLCPYFLGRAVSKFSRTSPIIVLSTLLFMLFFVNFVPIVLLFADSEEAIVGPVNFLLTCSCWTWLYLYILGKSHGLESQKSLSTNP